MCAKPIWHTVRDLGSNFSIHVFCLDFSHSSYIIYVTWYIWFDAISFTLTEKFEEFLFFFSRFFNDDSLNWMIRWMDGWWTTCLPMAVYHTKRSTCIIAYFPIQANKKFNRERASSTQKNIFHRLCQSSVS